jgi:NADPH:quinone reductase-like Zn-dependent oxidoreductase
MKAVVYHRYGSPDVLSCEEVETPPPDSGQVLVKMHAASVNPLDWHFMRGTPYFLRLMAGLRKPKQTRLGVDVAGEVVSIGANATRFKPGEVVFGACRGAFAEYVCVRESELAVKPENVTFEQAASVPIAALTALQALRDHGHVEPGQRVLINGAAGGVGTFGVQIAKVLGAQVTGVCSTGNLDLVRSIGADRVVDYTRQDFTTDADRYDVLLDCVGNRPLSACRRVLARDGKYLGIGGPNERWMIGTLLQTMAAAAVSRFRSQKVIPVLAKNRKEDLAMVAEWIAAGKVRPVIDRRYAMRDIAAAIVYVEAGHARGKVIIVPTDIDRIAL